MTAARFEVVHTKAGFHARFITSNGRIQWWTEAYNRRRNAIAAIELICGAPVLTSKFADHPEVMWAGNCETPTEVHTVDERPPPPAPVVIEAPFYVTTHAAIAFWHDHDYHYRHCHSDECAQRTPPAGTHVRGRLGIVTYQEKP